MQVRLAAIPSPINMLNLQAAGWWPTIWARMVQAERHARGCADFAYCLKHARSMPRFSWTTVALCLKVRLQMLTARPCLPACMSCSFVIRRPSLTLCLLGIFLGQLIQKGGIDERMWHCEAM